MSLLGNILWFIFGGFLSGLGWIIAGIVWCATIVGIPIGIQCFKLSALSFVPFGMTACGMESAVEKANWTLSPRQYWLSVAVWTWDGSSAFTAR